MQVSVMDPRTDDFVLSGVCVSQFIVYFTASRSLGKPVSPMHVR